MENKLKIKIILGSTREGRMGDKVANWVLEVSKEVQGMEFELLDLKQYPMPFLDNPTLVEGNPGYEIVQNWKSKIGEADGYIFVTAEYNHSYSAELKNAIDYLKPEWAKKPAAFVAYGGVAGGSRAIEHLRLVAAELQMTTLRDQVLIPMIWDKFDEQGQSKDRSMDKGLQTIFTQLEWWAQTLKNGRENIA
jgi:NAD(P)H-dependent FMN reductase